LDDDPSTIQNMVDGGIEARTTTDFAEDRSRNPYERMALVCHRKDPPRPFSENRALGSVSERVECLRVEN
jgi:hypothetical protein